MIFMEDVCQGIRDILGSARIMKIMAKTMTNNISTNKLHHRILQQIKEP
jgi:hypothetical protein